MEDISLKIISFIVTFVFVRLNLYQYLLFAVL